LRVYDLLEEAYKRYPSKAGLIFDDEIFSYERLFSMVNNVANFLLERGVRKFDRVLIYHENSPEAVVSVFAALKIGAVFTIINPDVKRDKIVGIMNDCSPSVLVTDRSHLSSIIEDLRNIHSLKNVIIVGNDEHSKGVNQDGLELHTFTEASEFTEVSEIPLVIDSDLACLIFTSGSTGTPKGVMMNHLNIISAAKSITQYLKNDENDVIISTLPLSFDYGLYQVIMSFMIGGTLILERSFTYYHEVLTNIAKYHVTGFPIVPSIAEIIIRLRKLSQYDFRSLRYITNTAQALPERTIRKLAEIFPEAEIYSMYGLTECKRVLYLEPNKILIKPNSVGKAMPNVEVKLIDEEGREILEANKIGQLIVRGSNVMLGYWNRPEETEKVLRDRLYPGDRTLFTGDYFYFDEDGDLYFIGRKDSIIKTGGEKVSPAEVEQVLYKIDGIKEAVVFGMKDDILGNSIMAAISSEREISVNELKRFCNERLERFMVPKHFEIMDDLPKNKNGKIDIVELKRIFEKVG